MIYKIMNQPDWAAFQANRVYHGSDADLADGYIHFSTRDQVPATLARHYPGQSDLILLAVAVSGLDSRKLKWEPARGGQLFPHLYTALPITGITAHWSVQAGPDNVHILPEELYQ